MPSSVVAEIKYDNVSHALSVVYVSGLVYDYKNVPEEIYAGDENSLFKGNLSQ